MNDFFTLSPDDRLLKTCEVAAYLGMSEKTLRSYRADGLGPVYFKFDRMVRYRLSDVRKWRDRNIHNPAETLGK